MEVELRAPETPLEHHSTMVLRGLSAALELDSRTVDVSFSSVALLLIYVLYYMLGVGESFASIALDFISTVMSKN